MKIGLGGNLVVTHRKKAGLSQRELGRLIGHAMASVSRHETARTEFALSTGLAYEALFGVPVSLLFPELKSSVQRVVEDRLEEFERELLSRSAQSKREAQRHAQKLAWIDERRSAADSDPLSSDNFGQV